METQRLIKRICNLPNNLERAYINDISIIIDQLLEEYDIFYKDTETSVPRNILISRFKLQLLNKDETNFCNGFSKNGNKCTNKTFEDSKYCKRHHYLTFKEQFESNLKTDIVILDNNKNENKSCLDSSALQSKMIDDTFYYIDDQFIYEKDTLQKVGYIEIDNGNKNYILTSDPFILGA